MKTKIAINGFGRIGRSVLKNALASEELEVVAINDLTDPKTLLHLFQYDSVYGKSEGFLEGNSLKIKGKEIEIFSEKDPETLPWSKLEVDVVLECTGMFTEYESALKHINAGAKKVIISAPSKNPEKIPSLVMGVNDKAFDFSKHEIIDMGSCTTNCLAPIVKALHDRFEVKQGFMTTIHSYTAGQNLLDGPHKDLRRARAAALNIVPTTTGAAKALKRVIPEIEDRIDGIALRVPTPTVSVLDLTCILGKEISIEELNGALQSYAKENSRILKVEDDPLVSSDYVGSTYSAVIDSGMSNTDGGLVKIVAWYDNEWAYARRLSEVASLIFK